MADVTPEMLSAYLDGDLDAAEHARVASALERSPELRALRDDLGAFYEASLRP